MNRWGNSPFLAPHILCCLHTYSLVQRNLNKSVLIYIEGRRFGHLPFTLEAIFHLPPSNYVLAKLPRVSMKHDSIISLKGISRVGVLSFRQSRYQLHLKRWETCQSLSKSFWNIVRSTLGHARCLGTQGVDQWHHGIIIHDRNAHSGMNYAFITKSKKWLPIFLPLVPKRREALW